MSKLIQKNSYKISKNDICRRCQGDGEMESKEDEESLKVKCTLCNGTGIVKIEKEITVRIYQKD